MKRDFNIHNWQAKYLRENVEGVENTLADYFSSRGGAVKRASKVVDKLIAGLDPDAHSKLVDAIIDLVDEIESDSDDNYDY
jgi:uncharacterized protein Yka (UPF0111/DUF47 family)